MKKLSIIFVKICFLLTCLLNFSDVAFCRDVYVNKYATGGNNGQNWLDAYESLDTAIEHTGPDDVIRVAQGEYLLTKTLVLYDRQKLIGGFNVDSSGQAQEDWRKFPTILDGAGRNGSDSLEHIVWLPAGNLLKGFTIKGGHAKDEVDDDEGGGGIVSLGSYVSNCHIIDNKAHKKGGGYYGWGTIENCIFENNSSNYGGAINSAGDRNPNGVLNIYNSVFISNSAPYGRDAFCYINITTFVNCTFLSSGNSLFLSSSYHGGSASFNIYNSIFKSRNAIILNAYDDEVHNNNGYVIAYIKHCVMPDGERAIEQRRHTNAICTAIYEFNPMFEGISDQTETSYKLSEISPCIDAGDNTLLPAEYNKDVDGQERFVDDFITTNSGFAAENDDRPIVDIGASEFQVVHAATVYQHCNQQGYNARLRPANYNLQRLRLLGVLDNDLSCASVEPGFKVFLYEQDHFTGRMLKLFKSEQCFVRRFFNDETSSIVVLSADDTQYGLIHYYPIIEYPDCIRASYLSDTIDDTEENRIIRKNMGYNANCGGSSGKYQRFDGENDYLLFPSNTIDLTQYRTINFLFNTNDKEFRLLANKDDNYGDKFLIKFHDGRSLSRPPLYSPFMSIKLTISMSGDSKTSNLVLNVSKWHMLTMVYSPSWLTVTRSKVTPRVGSSEAMVPAYIIPPTVAFYLDGNLVSSFRLSTETINFGQLLMGGKNASSQQTDEEFFHGFVDDIRIYNHAFSQEEVKTLLTTYEDLL